MTTAGHGTDGSETERVSIVIAGVPGLSRVVDLRTQVPDGVLTMGREPVRLSWRIHAGDGATSQTAYEVETASDDRFTSTLASTGVVELPDQIGVMTPGAGLASREIRYFRVRVRIDDEWTPWSHPVRAEAGLLEARDWLGRAVGLPRDMGDKRHAPLLRRTFDLRAIPTSARLYVTSLGLHQMTLNGRSITDDLLAPGWTPYHRRLLADAYDVTHLLERGPNCLAAMLGDGWYRGRLGWDPERGRAHYGTRLGLLAQLEVTMADGSSDVVVTDESWRASTGEVRAADLYDGASIDYRERQRGWTLAGFDDAGWAPVGTLEIDTSVIEPRVAPPVRVVAELLADRRDEDGVTILDGGQNIAGHVRLCVRGRRGDVVTVRHAEVLEPDGSIHVRSLRSARATDTYVLDDDGEATLEPVFTFHGFQYAEVRTTAEILDARFVAVTSAWSDRIRFRSAEPALDRLQSNVAWSFRDNFVSLPTDCPQRDERLGWTGDAQVFSATASTMFWSEALWASWLRDLELEQDDLLGVPSVVPDVVLSGVPRYGRAGWADAATMVPWSVYESYGDIAMLQRQFGSMRRWIASLEARCGADGLLTPGWQFGDWLDPAAPVERPWASRTDSEYVANAFFAHSARLVADAAELLGEPTVARHAGALAGKVATRTWMRWGKRALTTQTGCALALCFRIAPDEDRSLVAAALARHVVEADGHVATGFLGTPLVLPALSGSGYHDEAYKMLLCRSYPSWLYQVKSGATTSWERWDAIRPDGSIHSGNMRSLPTKDGEDATDSHMLSFNHYAYGAVMDWVYRHVGGIAPDRAAPGYRHTRFAPIPAVQVPWAQTTIETAYGPVSLAWHVDGEQTLNASLELPFGTTGTFEAPVTTASQVTLDGQRTGSIVDVPAGRHEVVVRSCRVADASRSTTRMP